MPSCSEGMIARISGMQLVEKGLLDLPLVKWNLQ
jgi:hypothetical protein